MELILFTSRLGAEAATIAPPGLRTLDAIHLVSARTLGEGTPFYCYDLRLSAAGRDSGLDLRQPA